jgi:hypothetical protein
MTKQLNDFLLADGPAHETGTQLFKFFVKDLFDEAEVPSTVFSHTAQYEPHIFYFLSVLT